MLWNVRSFNRFHIAIFHLVILFPGGGGGGGGGGSGGTGAGAGGGGGTGGGSGGGKGEEVSAFTAGSSRYLRTGKTFTCNMYNVNLAPLTFAISSPYNRPQRPRGGVEV